MFAPHAVVAEVKAVIAPQDDDGVVGKLEAVEFVEHATDLRIRKTGGGIVAVNQFPGVFVRERALRGNIAILAKFAPAGRRISWGAGGRFAAFGKLEGFAVVEIPVTFRRAEGEMRFKNSDREKEWFGRILTGGLQALDGFGSEPPIGIRFVGDVC